MSCAQLPLTAAQAEDSEGHGLPKEKISQLRQGLQILASPWLPLLISSGTSVFLWLLISYPTGFSFVLAFFLEDGA